MRLIAHRGNLYGPDPTHENMPKIIRQVIQMDFDAEIDVWLVDDQWYLGHDNPQHEINFSFLRHEALWCHAKNLAALDTMLKDGKIHCFWHQEDDFTVTSRGIIWAYPGMDITSNAVAVMPADATSIIGAYGICCDNVGELRGTSD